MASSVAVVVMSALLAGAGNCGEEMILWVGTNG
jgi:hypothetical protein